MADVVVAGAAGRMGSRLVALLQQETELRLVAALEAPGHPALGRDAGESAGVGRIGIPIAADVEAALGRDRILIEFSVPEASLAHARLVERHGGRAVIGTTGFSAAQREELTRIGRGAPLLVSPNMSVAVNVAFKVLADMARMLGDDYDVEIVETHHRFKKDAPSGTALRMAEVVAQALGRDLAATAVYDRHDRLAERTRKEIGMAALRSGDVVGEHTVSFASLGERLELTHRAHSRDNFARGALRGARFIATARPGLYSMQDVLGLA
ncbi:MAG TPA: 4-hydroxy-tetrahydrodipicolinate reductase [Methylomirabilota bacterium]|jgi:4-hydroxy-tetrahydrodipicolinate reductase|nr:4-hydroxy-tetrahydrodipicolinate reductase [Methylomirabilota bacterium]